MTTFATHPIAIKIDKDTRDRVKRLAEARHRTSHWLMREAISQYVEREEKREAFRQDGINAWNEYQTNGSRFAHFKSRFLAFRTKSLILIPWLTKQQIS